MRRSADVLLLVWCAFLVVACGVEPARSVPPRYRWVYVSANLLPAENLPKVEAILRRASAAGYNGIMLADYKLNILDRMDETYFSHVRHIANLAASLKLEVIPCVFPIGYSSGLLAHDPNLIEGMSVVDAPFVVHDGKADVTRDGSIAVANGGFEEADGDTARGWAFQDGPGRVSFIDREVKHSGAASLRIEHVGEVDPQNGHGRIMQRVRLAPHRCYHVTVWVRTRDFERSGDVRVLVLGARSGRTLCYLNLGVKRNQEWTQHQIVFNTLDEAEVNLYFGVWQGKVGALWFDDVRIEEAGLVNVIRRDGCPLVVRGEDGTVYEEGRDFQPVSDPKLGVTPWAGEYDLWHSALQIELTPQSRIREGQRLLVSWHHAVFVYDMQSSCCLTHPKVYALLRDQMERVEKLLHPTSVMMSHDEMRVAGWCDLCRKDGKTPGQLLAENVRRCAQIVRQVSPRARIYVWSDMLDPNHNAVDGYYLVNGTLKGSWEGLPKDVGVVNWYFDARAKSLPWFVGRGHEQVLAGYYDGDVGYTRAWLDGARDLPGIVGVMYTTWQDRYDDLEAFARATWGPR